MAKSAVPNIFTFSNLAFGILSLLMTFQSDFKLACIFILVAGLIDRYDGRVARFLNVSSDLGKELDSLADLVSFGVAPALLAYNLYNFSQLSIIGYALVLIFPIAGAYRLARYNSCDFNGIYMGVPITAAGVFIAFYSLILIICNAKIASLTGLTIVFLLMFSYLMVSKLKIKKI